MDLHEGIDRFGRLSPKIKGVTILIVIAAIAAVLGCAFYLGAASGRGWADSKYNRQRAENLINATRAEAEEARLRGVNDVLKKQNEDLAAELLESDAIRRKDAEAAKVRRDIELKTAISTIDAQSTAPQVICGTCETARRSGEPLSDEFCGQCWKQP